MRLIDAGKAKVLLDWTLIGDAADAACRVIDNVPTVDAVVVTRCKDCKHYLIVDEFDGGERSMCEVNHFSYLNSDGDMHFCSYGKPKEKL